MENLISLNVNLPWFGLVLYDCWIDCTLTSLPCSSIYYPCLLVLRISIAGIRRFFLLWACWSKLWSQSRASESVFIGILSVYGVVAYKLVTCCKFMSWDAYFHFVIREFKSRHILFLWYVGNLRQDKTNTFGCCTKWSYVAHSHSSYHRRCGDQNWWFGTDK